MGGLVAAIVAAASRAADALEWPCRGLATFAVLVIIFTVANSWTRSRTALPALVRHPDDDERDAALLVGARWRSSSPLCSRAHGLGFGFGARGRTTSPRSRSASACGPSACRLVVSARSSWGSAEASTASSWSFNAELLLLSLTSLTLAMLVIGGITSLSGAVIGSLAVSFVAEALHRIEQGVDVGVVRHPASTWPARGGSRDHHARDPDSPSAGPDERPRVAVAAAGRAPPEAAGPG